ncbi:MAG: DUF456 domain-containing protein [Planctomycetes bacterium]|nr:DUF456 domain-containing protein [Planctomycetota bacterium]NOG54469.1 DUF456 domain-containing protein [Planctomycetota bacterium]
MFTTLLILFSIVSVMSLALTLIGLPGAWLVIAVGIVCHWLQDWTWFSWWTIGGCIALALVGEVLEFASGAAGTHWAGGSKRSGAGALIGALVGGLAGSMFPPIIGALIWGVVGAGVGAIVAEITVHDDTGAPRTMKQTLGIGGGAAAGRLAGTISKLAVTAIIAIVMFVAAWIPGPA